MTAIDKLAKVLADLRNPETRWSTLWTLFIAALVASASIGAVQVGTQSTVALWQIAMERAQFPMIVAEIESVRSDLKAAPCESNAMLIAKAADWNLRIRHEHESNRNHRSDWASSDKWMDVKPIEMPCQAAASAH